MKLFSPSIAKILSTPVIFTILTIVLAIGISIFSPNTDFTTYNPVRLLGGGIILLLIAYGITCFIWQVGRNHRRLLTVLITFLAMFAVYFLGSILISYFGLCLPMDLPCIAGSSCPGTNTFCAPAFFQSGLCILIFILGALVFFREGKPGSNKTK